MILTVIHMHRDAHLVAWLKANAENGKYQFEINRVLRQHMNDAICQTGTPRKSV